MTTTIEIKVQLDDNLNEELINLLGRFASISNEKPLETKGFIPKPAFGLPDVPPSKPCKNPSCKKPHYNTYRKDLNDIYKIEHDFLNESVEKDLKMPENGRVSTLLFKDLYDKYTNWCNTKNYSPVSNQDFYHVVHCKYEGYIKRYVNRQHSVKYHVFK